MKPASPPGWALIALFLVAGSPAPVMAQWLTERFTPEEDGAAVNAAAVENADGYRFRVYRSAEEAIRAQFAIPESYDRLSQDTCPSWHVDDRFLASSEGESACRIGPWQADFVIAEIDGNRVHSPELDRVMRGNRLVVRYRIEGAGYRETSFGLGGSRRRVQAILGEGIRVIAR